MYTRFKSQKSRIKVGLKALSTNPSRTCIVASSTTPASSFKPMDEKQLQQSATCKQNCFTSQLLANERIPKPPKNSSRASKSKKLASFNSSDNDDYDLNVDAISISYVKSSKLRTNTRAKACMRIIHETRRGQLIFSFFLFVTVV